jgi:hypothetical protein
MNTALLARMQPIMRQPLMRLQAMKQPLQRQPLLRTSRPFHNTRTMLRVKASLSSLAYAVSRLTVALQEDEHSGKYHGGGRDRDEDQPSNSNSQHTQSQGVLGH